MLLECLFIFIRSSAGILQCEGKSLNCSSIAERAEDDDTAICESSTVDELVNIAAAAIEDVGSLCYNTSFCGTVSFTLALS